MTGPCLCGDTYCVDCGGVCPRCEGEGYILSENISDLEYSVFRVMSELEKNVNYPRCSCNPTDAEIDAYNEFMMKMLDLTESND